MKQSEKKKTTLRHDPTAAPKSAEKIPQLDPPAAPKSAETIPQLDPPASPQPEDLAVLPIERVTMPTDDVSDLRDVVDAINRLCETMKTSDYDDSDDNNDDELCEEVEIDVPVESEVGLVSPEQIVVSEVETYVAELWSDAASLHAEGMDAAIDSPTEIDTVSTLALHSCVIRNKDDSPVISSSTGDEYAKTVSSKVSQCRETNTDNTRVTQLEPVVIVRRVESVVSAGSDSVIVDHEPITASFEPVSEMYYTASSEVSLLSDVDLHDRITEETMEGREAIPRDDRNGVMAGHVAAMRERFESMTRANTPCPDVMRSVSPSLDVYRNITPSPDHLG